MPNTHPTGGVRRGDRHSHSTRPGTTSCFVFGADCITSEELTHALPRGRMFVGVGQVISPRPAPVRCQQKCATNVSPARHGIDDLQICPVPSLELTPRTPPNPAWGTRSCPPSD